MKNKCYKFTDVKDIIDKNKPKFILDEWFVQYVIFVIFFYFS